MAQEGSGPACTAAANDYSGWRTQLPPDLKERCALKFSLGSGCPGEQAIDVTLQTELHLQGLNVVVNDRKTLATLVDGLHLWTASHISETAT